jgi:hypothetical protein
MVRQVLQEQRLRFKIRGDLKKQGYFPSVKAPLTIRLEMKEVSIREGVNAFFLISTDIEKTYMTFIEKHI